MTTQVIMESQNIGSFLARESLTTEFKQFCLKGVYDKFDESEMEALLQDIVDDNATGMTSRLGQTLSLVPYSLVRTIENVVPKYATVFLNSGIPGTLYLGISDSGEVTGIPWPDGMDLECVTSAATRAVTEMVRGGDDDLLDMIDFKLIPVRSREDEGEAPSSTPLSDALRGIRHERVEYNQKLAAYKMQRSTWGMHLEQYSLKLADLVNTPSIRLEFVRFVRERCDSEDCPPFVEILASDPYEYYSFETRYYMQSDESRGNIKHVWYWITMFKESKMKEINAMKPVFPKPPRRNASVIVSRLEDLRPALSRVGVGHVVLCISFRGDLYNSRTPLSFRYPCSSEWYTKRRVVDRASGEPVTEDINSGGFSSRDTWW